MTMLPAKLGRHSVRFYFTIYIHVRIFTVTEIIDLKTPNIKNFLKKHSLLRKKLSVIKENTDLIEIKVHTQIKAAGSLSEDIFCNAKYYLLMRTLR